MKEKVEQVKSEIESFLKDNMEHQDKHIDFILINPDTDETICYASDGVEEMIVFAPYTKENDKGYLDIPEWDFNYDSYVFEELEKGYRVGYISDETHYGIWNSLQELYPVDIEHKDGVQNYLQFCSDNGITKKYLDTANNLDTPDIMKHFEGLALFETMEYKGYIIEADGTNTANVKKNFVNIYENRQDYDNEEPIETVSLNTIGLKQNIREYIDEFYIDKTVIESEKAYFTFVLGYDLLNDMLSKSSTPENDVSYDFCNMIANEFLQSEEYKNEKNSAYEMLEQWVEKNRSHIKESHKDFIGEEKIGKTRQLDDGMYVMDVGYRNNSQPVALVERTLKDDSKEYIIAFYYTINDNKIDWSYGYYYDNDIQKAKEDFDKVLKGGTLTNTFNKNKSDKEER